MAFDLSVLKGQLGSLQGLIGDIVTAISARGENLGDDISVIVDIAGIAAALDPPLAIVAEGAEALRFLAPLIALKLQAGAIQPGAPYASTGDQGGGPGVYRGR